MIRTKHIQRKKVDAILTGDWHLQEGVPPVCRLDNFEETQWRKVQFISELQKEHNCPVVHSGDLFDFWKPSPELLTKTMLRLPDYFYTIYGNHDLPQHNLELAVKSGVNTLAAAGKLCILEGIHWGQSPVKLLHDQLFRKPTLIWHIMTYQGKEPWPGCTDPKAASLLRKYPQFDLILTGDNHKPFVEEFEGRLLVNPGSIFRTTASQQDHKPRVYLWYADTNTVSPVYIPIESDVISREHIERQEERNNRIDAFITTLNQDWQTGNGFEENLARWAKVNDIRKSVMDIIYRVME